MSKVEHIADGVTLMLGDCRDILPSLGNIDAVVTSPPYDGLREYGEQGSNPSDCVPLVARVIASGGVVVWNVSDQVIDGSESGTSFRQALSFMGAGLRLHDTMIYCKEVVTFPDNNRYHPAFEYMFVFSNGAPRHFNGIRDWKNKSAGRTALGSTQRNPDGSTVATSSSRKNATTPEYSLRRNWWILSNAYTGDTAGHPAPMPYQLAADHIATWTGQGGLVLDPFAGSGTAGVASVNLGRRFIGIEIEAKYFDLACRRIDGALKQKDLFIEKPEPLSVQIPLLDAAE